MYKLEYGNQDIEKWITDSEEAGSEIKDLIKTIYNLTSKYNSNELSEIGNGYLWTYENNEIKNIFYHIKLNDSRGAGVITAWVCSESEISDNNKITEKSPARLVMRLFDCKANNTLSPQVFHYALQRLYDSFVPSHNNISRKEGCVSYCIPEKISSEKYNAQALSAVYLLTLLLPYEMQKRISFMTNRISSDNIRLMPKNINIRFTDSITVDRYSENLMSENSKHIPINNYITFLTKVYIFILKNNAFPPEYVLIQKYLNTSVSINSKCRIPDITIYGSIFDFFAAVLEYSKDKKIDKIINKYADLAIDVLEHNWLSETGVWIDWDKIEEFAISNNIPEYHLKEWTKCRIKEKEYSLPKGNILLKKYLSYISCKKNVKKYHFLDSIGYLDTSISACAKAISNNILENNNLFSCSELRSSMHTALSQHCIYEYLEHIMSSLNSDDDKKTLIYKFIDMYNEDKFITASVTSWVLIINYSLLMADICFADKAQNNARIELNNEIINYAGNNTIGKSIYLNYSDDIISDIKKMQNILAEVKKAQKNSLSNNSKKEYISAYLDMAKKKLNKEISNRVSAYRDQEYTKFIKSITQENWSEKLSKLLQHADIRFTSKTENPDQFIPIYVNDETIKQLLENISETICKHIDIVLKGKKSINDKVNEIGSFFRKAYSGAQSDVPQYFINDPEIWRNNFDNENRRSHQYKAYGHLDGLSKKISSANNYGFVKCVADMLRKIFPDISDNEISNYISINNQASKLNRMLQIVSINDDNFAILPLYKNKFSEVLHLYDYISPSQFEFLFGYCMQKQENGTKYINVKAFSDMPIIKISCINMMKLSALICYSFNSDLSENSYLSIIATAIKNEIEETKTSNMLIALMTIVNNLIGASANDKTILFLLSIIHGSLLNLKQNNKDNLKNDKNYLLVVSKLPINTNNSGNEIKSKVMLIKSCIK